MVKSDTFCYSSPQVKQNWTISKDNLTTCAQEQTFSFFLY